MKYNDWTHTTEINWKWKSSILFVIIFFLNLSLKTNNKASSLNQKFYPPTCKKIPNKKEVINPLF